MNVADKANLQEKLDAFQQNGLDSSLKNIKRGFEKECLRVNKEGFIATTKHPEKLGSSLTHPFITTDYSEALIEFITPPTDNIQTLFETLHNLEQYTYQVLDQEGQGEYLWNLSMPCHLPKENAIPIANYGESYIGKLKTIYRKGLGLRYGRRMQTIAGIHYNFSLSRDFWINYQKHIRNQDNLSHFISEQYLALLRNGLRYGWIISLLYGASPAVNADFVQGSQAGLEKLGNDTLIEKFATSLRLSDLGYQNKNENIISYNSFSEYLNSMQTAIHTVSPEFSRFGVINQGEYQQLSDCRLQIEAEHYAGIRPKRVASLEERTLKALMRDGIEYLEIRALDINPYIPLGINPEIVYFLDIFLILCLLLESSKFTDMDYMTIRQNAQLVVNQGRKKDVKLVKNGNEITLIEWAFEIIYLLEIVAKMMDKGYNNTNFSEAVQQAKQKINDMHELPSARILTDLHNNNESYFEFGKRWSTIHQNRFLNTPMENNKWEEYMEIAKNSLEKQRAIEKRDENTKLSFSEYLQKYLKE